MQIKGTYIVKCKKRIGNASAFANFT